MVIIDGVELMECVWILMPVITAGKKRGGVTFVVINDFPKRFISTSRLHG